MKRAYYTILRYCPDPIRGEQFNVGVLAVGAQSWCFRRLEAIGPIRKYARSFPDGILVDHQKLARDFFEDRPYYLRQPDGRKTTTNRINTEVLTEFITRFRGPQLSYGPICRVEGNIDSSFALESFATDLQEQFLRRQPLPSRSGAQRQERVKTILRNEFDACDFFNRDKYRCPMEADRDVELERHGYRLPVSFSFDNGKLHVFEPIDALEERDSLSQLRQVALVAMVFQKLREEYGDRLQPYACLIRPPGARDLRELAILKEHAKIVDLSRKNQKEKFFLQLHKRLRPRSAEFLQF